MKKFIKNQTSLFVKICVAGFFFVFFILLLILKTNQGICEAWTVGFSRFYQSTLGWVYKFIPFSLTEWIIIGLVISLVTLLVLMIVRFVKRRFIKGFHSLANIAIISLCVLSLYFATAEMAYNRAPVPIELYEEKVDKSEFRNIIDYYVSDLRYCTSMLTIDENGELHSPYSNEELNKVIEKEYEKLKGNPYYTDFTTYSKPMLFSFLFREFHITGVTFLPTTEANINNLQTDSEKPFTFAHEVAHSKGVMREEDANLVAAYLCLSSEDPYLRYSGYLYTISSLLDLGNYTGVKDEISAIYSTLPNAYKNNRNYINAYWASHRSLSDFANWWNDLYLKISGQDKGTESYNDTPIEVDPTTREISSFSTYQKLYFQLYFN